MDLYKFEGKISMGTEVTGQELDLKQFLHRGTILKNSHYVDALVIYTGENTKVIMNQGRYRFKIS